MSTSSAFENESLSEKVKRTIVDRVVDGTYPPGMRLVELQLAKEFGVSQAPVREALRELSTTRLVENIPRRGTFVRAATQDDLSEVYFVRLALEGTAAAAAYPALHADPSPLREALAGMREAAASNDAHGIARYSTQFHRAVVAATGNRLMTEIWDSLYVEARTMATVVRGHVDLETAAEAHVPILEAFESGTPELCTSLVIAHQHEYSILPQG
ncbi:GntR family transcriptional regulator [Paeniglutamicibacter psychrophenolicus]|uniref:DNA-binding GntR family transcriptional regulator n=1 Tax=Paeniglutamicibacter psychrophenolicus TaxID=257454 RepID=A0ABS4W9F0_9MICC|nr:GntR family transcriptional regulator [Paeniglutamicibacter psychrophenolicus]MBP2372826.1 DNA-binding GntR family transcriptional regulator [Paeniglutamicibacter psychrophenolicus]